MQNLSTPIKGTMGGPPGVEYATACIHSLTYGVLGWSKNKSITIMKLVLAESENITTGENKAQISRKSVVEIGRCNALL